MFAREKRELIGLDVGSSGVKLLKLKKHKKSYCVTNAGWSKIKSSENDPARAAVQNCMTTSGCTSGNAVMALAGSNVAVRSFNFPSLPDEAIEGAVKLEAMQVCPVDSRNSIVDYQVVSKKQGDSGNSEVQGVLVAAVSGAMNKKLEILNTEPIKCVLMDVEPLALINCFVESTPDTKDETFIIVNAGYSFSTMIIQGKDKLPFVRDIAFGVSHMAQRIASQNETDDLLIESVLEGKVENEELLERLNIDIETSLQGLVEPLEDTLRYYASQYRIQLPDKMYLCGGLALVNGVTDVLTKSLNREVVLWNPFDSMDCSCSKKTKETIKKYGPAFAVAAGLAMRTI